MRSPRTSILWLGLALAVALGVGVPTLTEAAEAQDAVVDVPLVDLLETEQTEPVQSTAPATAVYESLLPAPTTLSTCPIPPPPPPTSCICGGCCECRRCWSGGTLAKCIG